MGQSEIPIRYTAAEYFLLEARSIRRRLLLPLLHLGGHFAAVGLQLLEFGRAQHLLKLFLGGYIDALLLGQQLG